MPLSRLSHDSGGGLDRILHSGQLVHLARRMEPFGSGVTAPQRPASLLTTPYALPPVRPPSWEDLEARHGCCQNLGQM